MFTYWKLQSISKKCLDGYAGANRVDPDQTAPRGAV